jgi:hypothetical protein
MRSIRHIALSSLAGLALSLAIPGCEAQHPDTIPTSAQIMDSGNQMVHFIAPSDGMTYVYDKSGQRLLWSGIVTRGQAVDIDPIKNRITVGGIVAADRILHANSQHVVYFDAYPAPAPVVVTPPPPASNTPNSNSVIVTPNATVQQGGGQVPPGSVTVQPGLSVSPATTPVQPNPQH